MCTIIALKKGRNYYISIAISPIGPMQVLLLFFFYFTWISYVTEWIILYPKAQTNNEAQHGISP